MATLGKILLDGTDIITRKTFDYPDRPTGERKAWDLSKFAEDESKPARSTKYLTKFYEMYDEIGKAQATFNNYRKTGQGEKAKDWWEDHKQVMAMAGTGNHIKKALSAISSEKKRIQRSTKYDAAEKRTRIDDLTRKRNALVKNGFKAIRKAKNNGRDK